MASIHGFKLMAVGCIAFFMVSCFNAFPANGKYNGVVVKIIDGDSIVVMRRGEKGIIRFYGIDAPEWDQPFALLAKKYLESNVLNKNVEVKHLYEDSYQRSIALVSLENLNVNQALVDKGYAWVHRHYCKKKICSEWLELEARARENRRGLWLGDDPTAPWIWKHR